VSRVSSMSPCRQFWPSILAVDAMLPAPKAWVGRAQKMRRMRQGRSKEADGLKDGMIADVPIRMLVLTQIAEIRECCIPAGR